MGYYVFLKNYDSLYIVNTKAYNDKVSDILKWFYGDYYDIQLVLKDPEVVLAEKYTIETKERILEDIDWKVSSYYFDEEGEELKTKIEFLKSILD